MRRTGRATMLAGAFLFFAPAAQASEIGAGSPGPQGAEQGAWRSQQWLVPLPGERLLMHTTVLRPPGAGPFPVAVINHGSSQGSYARGQSTPSLYRHVSQWFLERGYVVILPIRGGHDPTGGPYFEDQGRCEDPDYEKAGAATADSIQAAVDYFTAQPFVNDSGAVVVGQSAGGWGALALASRNPAKVRAVVNISGGRGGHADGVAGRNCAPERLVAAAGTFGRSARIATLWLYAENDTYFAPALSRRMAEAFGGAGGIAEYHLLRPTAGEGHFFVEETGAAPLWTPFLEKFLAPNR